MTGATAPVLDSRPAKVAGWLALVFFLFALAVGTIKHFTSEIYPYDDAYISYRYVDNVVAGRGLVYNEGERVFGASTPLYVGWLSLMKVAARDVSTPDLAVRTNALFFVGLGIGMILLLARLVPQRWLAAVLAGLFILRGDLAYVSGGGMETLMFAGMTIWALWALATDRFVVAAVLAGLLVMVRPEGVFVAAITLAAWLLVSRRRPVVFLSSIITPATAWLVFALAYFGTPIYQSLVAKTQPLYPIPAGAAFRDILGRWAVWASGGLVAYLSGVGSAGRTALFLAIALGTTVLAVLGLALQGRDVGRLRVILPLPAALILLAGFYSVSNPFVFPWYYPPLEALWFVTVAAGIALLAWRLGRNRAWLRNVILVLLLMLLGYPTMKPYASRLAAGGSIFVVDFSRDSSRSRCRGYRDAAEWLNGAIPDGVAVAAPEIGAFGYYYKGPILDVCGLISPEAVRYQPVPPEDRYDPRCGTIPLRLVQDMLPEVIATIPLFANLSIYDQDWFRETYVLIRRFPLPEVWWGSKNVEVWFRRDRVEL